MLLPAVAVPTVGMAAVTPADGYPSCATYRFCGYDGTGGTGLMMEWSGTIACGERKDLRPLGWADRIESVDNNSTARIVLWEEDAGTPVIIWISDPGNWGDLPPHARNRADVLQRARC